MNELLGFLELRHLTKLELSLMAGALCILCIAFLAYTVYINRHARWNWQVGQIWGLLQLFAAFVLIFIPFWSRYAAVTGMWGVFFITLSSAVARGQEARKQGVSETEGRRAIIWATVLALIIGLLAAPAFTLISNQQVIRGQAVKSSNILVALYNEIQGLRADLERDHADRVAQVHRDSLVRGLILYRIEGVKQQVQQGLRNDKDVKSALKRKDSSKPAPKPNYNPLQTKPPKVGFTEASTGPDPAREMEQ